MSEDVYEVLADLASALENAAAVIRQSLGKRAGVKTWDPANIKWESTEGAKGPFERSEDVDNREFKAMVKDLAAHGNRLTREGYFYWLFGRGDTVGRKKR